MSFEVTSYSIHRSGAKIKKMLLCKSLNKNLITIQSVILFKDSFLGYVFLVSSYKILGCTNSPGNVYRTFKDLPCLSQTQTNLTVII